MGDCVEAQLDDLLAEGGDSVVESIPLVHHPLGSEAGLHVGEPSVSVVVTWLFAAIVGWRV
jgi:hypothetical protein